jgi:pimeloyl-ACP methyl ester carboxylesterase
MRHLLHRWSLIGAGLLAGCDDRPMSPTRIAGPAGALAIDDGGKGGLPVVLVHSLAGSSAHWAGVLEHLRASRRAVAINLRGHGQSEPAKNGDYSIAGTVGDIAAAADQLKLRRFILVGHSLGGGVALDYAGAHPDRVAGLLLLDPIGDGTQTPAPEVKSFLDGLKTSYDSFIQEYWSQIAGPDTAIREQLLADLRATPREAVVRGLESVMQYDPKPALARYRGPIFSVVTPYNEQPFSLHRLGKGFPHQVVDGTGHWIQLDKPEVFNRLLDDFLKQSVSGKSKQRER